MVGPLHGIGFIVIEPGNPAGQLEAIAVGVLILVVANIES